MRKFRTRQFYHVEPLLAEAVRISVPLLGEVCAFFSSATVTKGQPELIPLGLIFGCSEGSCGNALDLIMANGVFTSEHFKLMKNLENINLVIMQSPESSK